MLDEYQVEMHLQLKKCTDAFTKSGKLIAALMGLVNECLLQITALTGHVDNQVNNIKKENCLGQWF